MSDIDISQVLDQMRAMAARAQGAGAADGAQSAQGAAAGKPDFSALLKGSIESVNATQKHAGELTEKFQAGEPGTDVAQVMVALQKASVSFEAMKQVRNKLVDAYQEIMRMQV